MSDERSPVPDLSGQVYPVRQRASLDSSGLIDRLAEREDTDEAEDRVRQAPGSFDMETGFEACSAIVWTALLSAVVLAGIIGVLYFLTFALS